MLAVAAALALAVTLALAGCGSGPDKRFAAAVVQPATVVERVSAPGTVQAAAVADLVAPAAARIQALRVSDGASVRRGQVLAQLSSDQVDAAIRQAQAALAAASSLDGAVPSLPTGAALAALSQLQQQVSASSGAVLDALRAALPLLPATQRAKVQASLDQAARRIAAAQQAAGAAAQAAAGALNQQTAALRNAIGAATAAQRSQAQLALDLANQQKAALTLRAPLSGTVQLGRSTAATPSGGIAGLPSVSSLPESAQSALQSIAGGAGTGSGPPLRAGSQVSAGQTVATVYDVSTLMVAAEVDETDIPLVRVGQEADVELDAFPGASFFARVRRISVAPTQSQSAAGGAAYEVDLAIGRLEQAGGTSAGNPVPRVGMTATAEIHVRRAVQAPTVPASALIEQGTGGAQAVYVIEGGHVHLRTVTVAAEGSDQVAVASGVRNGERVVARGAERLHDGQAWPGG
jgi:multidrug efflux pump subunit AcrA (membrane-fusion protein)